MKKCLNFILFAIPLHLIAANVAPLSPQGKDSSVQDETKVVCRYSNGDRSHVINHLRTNKKLRVLDVGYSASTWSSEFTTHYVDIIPVDHAKVAFIGDINFPQVWDAVDEDVSKNGPFDYCICSHTLEDIINPVFVANMINKYCKSGFVAMPSKFLEMTRGIDGNYRGYIHHRYIYNIENNQLVGYPKLNFIEHDSRFDALANQYSSDKAEIQVYWDGGFRLTIVNDNFMGPTVKSVLNYYNRLLTN